MTDRHARQSQIAGWDQQRLASKVVAVVGDGYLGLFAVAALQLLGVGEVRWIGRPPSRPSALTRVLLADHDAAEAPQVLVHAEVESANEVDWLLGPGVEILLGCAEQRAARAACAEVAARRGIPGFWAGASEAGGWFATGMAPSAGAADRQDPALALVAAAVLVDAVRQHVLAPSELAPADGPLPSIPAAPGVPQRVVQVGAGGIGTFSALLSLLLGVRELILIDPDHVEQSNLNRCVLFFESHARGGVNKAEAAAVVLRRLFPAARVVAVRQRAERDGFTGQLSGWRPGAVLSAVDNAEARLVISTAARHAGMPVVQGGVDTWLADVHTQGRQGELLDAQLRGALGRAAQDEAARRRPVGCVGSYVAPQMAAAALMGLRLAAVGGPGADSFLPPFHWRAGGLPYEAVRR